MLKRLFHSHDAEPSDSQHTKQQQSPRPTPAPFVEPHSSPDREQQPVAARVLPFQQPSQSSRAPSQPQESEEEEDEEGEEEGEEQEESAACPSPLLTKPALQQVPVASSYKAQAAAQAQRAPSLLPEPSASSVHAQGRAAAAAGAAGAAAPQPAAPPAKPAVSTRGNKQQQQPQKQQLQQQQQLRCQSSQLVQPNSNGVQPNSTGVQPSSRVEELQQQLLLEAKAREELEDMLLRYERQLKAEIQARQAAEAAAAEALAGFSQNPGGGSQLTADWQHQQEQLQQDRATLESMRADFEAQLHTARSEVAKAQAAMSSNEAQVRAEAAAACECLAAEYESRMAMMAGELDRTRQELASRTQRLAGELDRWKRQAAAAASAVLEAKDEVLKRKRELDSTKDKMDVLLDKLYAGKEANSNLSGALAAAVGNYNQQVLPGSYYGMLPAQDSFSQQPAATARTGRMHQAQQPNSRASPARQQHQQEHMRAQQRSQPQHTASQHATAAARHQQQHQQHQQQHYQQQQQLMPASPGSPFFLPPLGGQQGSLVGYAPMSPWQHTWSGSSMAGPLPSTWQLQQQQHMGVSLQPPPHLRHTGAAAGLGTGLPGIPGTRQQQQQQQLGSWPSSSSPAASKASHGKGGSYAQQLKAHGAAPAVARSTAAAGPHSAAAPAGPPPAASPSSVSTASRLPRYAGATKSSATAEAATAKAKASSSSSKKQQVPDRFKESSRNVAMIAAIANRW